MSHGHHPLRAPPEAPDDVPDGALEVSGIGRVGSLAEALARVPEGGLVRLGAGTFPLLRGAWPLRWFGRVVAPRSCTLEGRSALSTVLLSDARSVALSVPAGVRLRLRDLTLAHRGRRHGCLLEVAGALEAERCGFRGCSLGKARAPTLDFVPSYTQQGVALRVSGSGTAFLRSCELFENGSGGLALHDTASAELEGCTLRDNGYFGASAHSLGSKLTCRGSRFERCFLGVHLRGFAGGEKLGAGETHEHQVLDCDFEACRAGVHAGSVLTGSRAPRLVGNRFTRNVRGVNVHFQASCLVEGNAFVGNEECGVWVRGASSTRPLLQGNTFRESGVAGVWLHGECSAVLRDNSFRERVRVRNDSSRAHTEERSRALR